VTALAARRRHPLATAVLVLLGLFVTGAVYALVGTNTADASTTTASSADVSSGRQLFLANCSTCHGMNAEGRNNAPSLVGVGAMCHNSSGKGGALTRGKYAPSLTGVSGKDIYEAMVTGPQSMPVFNDNTMDPQSKKDIITYLTDVNETPNVGGLSLGRLGPVSEGLVAWVVGLTALIGCAVWLGSKSA
jgi:mono/diheme cytochrome c family protein